MVITFDQIKHNNPAHYAFRLRVMLIHNYVETIDHLVNEIVPRMKSDDLFKKLLTIKSCMQAIEDTKNEIETCLSAEYKMRLDEVRAVCNKFTTTYVGLLTERQQENINQLGDLHLKEIKRCTESFFKKRI